MKVSPISKYLKEHNAVVKRAIRQEYGANLAEFYTPDGKILAEAWSKKQSLGNQTRVTIFKLGEKLERIYQKVTKTHYNVICDAWGANDNDLPKPIPTTIIQDITEIDYENRTKKITRQVRELLTPYKERNDVSVIGKAYKLEGKPKYSEPEILDEIVEKF